MKFKTGFRQCVRKTASTLHPYYLLYYKSTDLIMEIRVQFNVYKQFVSLKWV